MTDPRENLGEFEHQVLLAALRLGPETYSVPIVLELERRTGRAASPAAVYIALRRLEEKGLAVSEMRRDEDNRARSRRYFRVTDEGKRTLGEAKRRFASLWEGLDPLLG